MICILVAMNRWHLQKLKLLEQFFKLTINFAWLDIHVLDFYLDKYFHKYIQESMH